MNERALGTNPAVPAVVLSCAGAPEGDLNLVRALGERGVPVIVVSEYADAPAAASRHCRELVVAEDFSVHPERLPPVLAQIHSRIGTRPVVFPSADPDLAVLIARAQQVEAHAISCVVDPFLSGQLTDKQAFHVLADAHELPVPRTASLEGPGVDEVQRAVVARLRFPLIVKPSHPKAWHDPALPAWLGQAKAIPLESAERLREILIALGGCRAQTLAQELIPGDDHEHYDVHAYIGRDGALQASYCGCKLRIYPPHAGSGCYVESVRRPEIETLACAILRRIGYRGIANMNFKRHSRTGEFLLLEINPRVSQWSILTTRSGVDIPWLAYCDALGRNPGPAPVRRFGVRYVNEIADLRAMRQYRAETGQSAVSYLGSWLYRPLVQQLWQWGDPRPGLRFLRRKLARRATAR